MVVVFLPVINFAAMSNSILPMFILLIITDHTNSAIHCVNTRNKHYLHRPIANLTCFQKNVYYSGIKVFNNLPASLKSLMNEKTTFKIVLKQYLNTHSFYSFHEFLLPKRESAFYRCVYVT
jgi:hypothetical protein